ncbi:endonuclease/exonuclease/phosphatase family protein [Vagococcus zengguangii]|uniref:Hydrolase n=1 Tax=Vagococcus zengguangii TaxID=2571750 RepID=A0A4D7CTY1_9ENTE|nr:endonuclease/exonuclease/phosphatase family protein [Vagococcus zengguangii]QCI85746.1 hydrolase [Vagococcus zengguangii]TLG81687.1 hydrolase [Vagococcus zengguangii]
MTHTLLTLNIHSWLETEPLKKLQQLAQVISKQNYSLVALQEVNQLITSPLAKTDEYFCPTDEAQMMIKTDNFALLLVERLKELGQHYYWGWAYNHIGYDKYEEGVALLSKTPLTTQQLTISESHEPTDYRTRTVLIGQTELDNHSLTIVSGHYSWWLDEHTGFAYEWQTLTNQLPTSDCLLLAGDFNNPAHLPDEGYELIMASPLTLTDAFIEAPATYGEFTVEKNIDGWQNNTQQLRIDFIFGHNIKFNTYQIKFDGKDSPVVSDHFGIESEFII